MRLSPPSTDTRSTLHAGHMPAISSAFRKPPIAERDGRLACSRTLFRSATSTQIPPHSPHRWNVLSSREMSFSSTLHRGQSMTCAGPPRDRRETGRSTEKIQAGSRSERDPRDSSRKPPRLSTTFHPAVGGAGPPEGGDQPPQRLGVELQGHPVDDQAGGYLQDRLLDHEPVRA